MVLLRVLFAFLFCSYICNATLWSFSPDAMRNYFREKYGVSEMAISPLRNRWLMMSCASSIMAGFMRWKR